MNDPYVLIIYYSRYGATQQMADFIGRGVESVNGIEAKIRTVPNLSPISEATASPIPDSGAPYVTLSELENCSGLIIGSPTRFGNMAAPLKYFLDSTSSLWLSGKLSGKPAGVFTSTSSHHGGQESTLLTMIVPLLHHGMLIVGVPFTDKYLQQTQTGGTPYGPSHYAGPQSKLPISEDEKGICMTLGTRVAQLSLKLSFT